MPADETDGPASTSHTAPVEEVLQGNSTSVVRRGDAVHRTAGPWTPTVHALLDHLAARGVRFLPRPLGFDEQGREVLTHLPGTVPAYPLPPHVWTPTVLATAGRQLAEVHAASRSFLARGTDGSPERAPDTEDGPRPEPVWQQPVRTPVEVVCLNDVAPHNMVFDDDGHLTGWIDVDTASPGPRVWDLAHLAYRLVPLTGAADSGAGAPDVVRYRRRLAALCQAYAMRGDEVTVTAAEVLPNVVQRLESLARDAEGRYAAGAGHLDGHGAHYRREAEWVEQHVGELAEEPAADLVVLTGPIAAGKSTVAAALAAAAADQGLTAVVVDVDDVADAVAAPGAGATGLWLSAHHAHGALVGRWVRTPVDVVIAVGPIYSEVERAAVVQDVPTGVPVHWVLLEAPVAVTLARATGDATRGISREADFHLRCHARFEGLRAGIPAVQVFDTSAHPVEFIVEEVLTAVASR